MRSLIIMLLMCSGISKAFTQEAVDTMRFVDFHAHTTTKNYNRDIPVPDSIRNVAFTSTHNIDNWEGKKHRKKFSSQTKFSAFYGKSSYPQASWNMVAQSPSSILCTSITPIEKRFVSDRRVKVLFLKPKLSFINRLAVTKLKKQRQHTIYNGSSFNEMMSEYQYMTMQRSNPVLGKKNVRLVKDGEDLQKARVAKETALVLTLEGGHILLGDASLYNEFKTNYGINENNIYQIYDHIDSLKQLPHHVFFLTLSHMSYNGFSGQAKSLDVKSKVIRKLLSIESGKKDFRIVFRKSNAGIADSIYAYKTVQPEERPDPCVCNDPITSRQKAYGWEVVRRLLDKNNHQHRILIDLRHTDVLGRSQYINYVKAWNNDSTHTGDHIPLIISHAAVNAKNFRQDSVFGTCPLGDRYKEIRYPARFYKEKNNCSKNYCDSIELGKTGWFHPFSINLYNEEIENVYESDGIIGITLEERVLGKGRPNYDRRHFKQLYNYFTQQRKLSRKDFNNLKTIEPFMRNLLYVVEHSGYAGKIASWEHVSIGSDFDGIIDPIDVCSRITDIPKFYSLLQVYLPIYAKYLNKEPLLFNTAMPVLLNKLFYENGERFIYKYFN